MKPFVSNCLKLVVIVLIVAAAFAGQTSISYGANASTTTSSTVPAFANTGTTVSSGGVEEPYIVQQVASTSNPSVVYQIVGAQIATRDVSGALKNYLYLFVNTAETFPLNTTGETAKDIITGYDTNNVYWNVQDPPSSEGGSTFCGTVGQDLDLGATSNTISEWQWSDLNYGCGHNQISYSGSYDGGGPSACYTYSSNQLRESVYVIIVNSATDSVYFVNGAELVEQNINGVASTTYVALLGNAQGRLVTSGDLKDCPELLNPSPTPSLRWYVRTPPVSGKISGATITGNFGITGTVGAGITKAPEDGSMVFEQFVDRSFQTGFIPNEGGPTDISIASSTNPVSGQTCQWPGTGCSSSSSTSTTSSTTTIGSSSSSSSTTTTTFTTTDSSSSNTTTTATQTLTTSPSTTTDSSNSTGV